MNDAPPIGHNNPPPYDRSVLESLVERQRGFLETASGWLQVETIDKESRAQQLTDFIAGVKALKKQVDEARKKAKQPHLDAGRQVDDDFRAVIAPLDRALVGLEPLLRAYLKRKEQEAAEERARKQAELDAERAEIERMERQAQERHDLAGEADAEAAKKRLAKEQKAVDRPTRARVESLSGGTKSASVRKVRKVRCTSVVLGFQRYRDHPEVAELLGKLAADEMRKAGKELKLPGFEVYHVEKAV